MFALRCTQKLQRRIGYPLSDVSVPPDTLLGDWYGNLLVARPSHLALCVSERTLLPVVVEAKNPAMFRSRMVEATSQVLAAIGVTAQAIERECSAMDRVYLTKTENKSILGSLNDLMFNLKHSLSYKPDLTLLQRSLWLAETPCKPIGHNSPDRATRELFASHAQPGALRQHAG
jgi:hypothetical protein